MMMQQQQQQQQAGQPVPPPSDWAPQPVPPLGQMQQYSTDSAVAAPVRFDPSRSVIFSSGWMRITSSTSSLTLERAFFMLINRSWQTNMKDTKKALILGSLELLLTQILKEILARMIQIIPQWIFVGGLDPSVSEDQLKQIFSQLREVVHVKIPANKHCGFVQYANRANTEQEEETFDFHGDVVLQANRLNQIRPSGMVDIMDMLKDLKHMDMHLLPKILTCPMGAILDMGITSNHKLTNNHSSEVWLLYCGLKLVHSSRALKVVGVGKTTLAEVVGKQATEEKLFDKVVIVRGVSQNPDINKIQHRISEILGLKFNASTEEGKAEELFKRLKGEKKILIILDDVWEQFELRNIGIPFGDKHPGCKILLTTRLRQVCSQMNCQEEFKLNILSEDEAWALFKDNAGLKDASPTLNDVAKEVAREAKGLPLAIVTMAKALKRESLNGWIAANQRLKESRHLDNQDVCGGIYSCLKLSYDYLKEENIQSCFLLCSLFPEDYDINVVLLTEFGIGQGLFCHINLIEEIRREIHLALSKLQKFGLLLETDDEYYVKMHDVVRDFAHWITSRGENMFMVKNKLTEWPKSEIFGCYTTISLWNIKIDNFPDKLEFSKLKTLFLTGEDYLRVPSKFFEGMKTLRVLFLQRVVFSIEALQFLTNLRTLCIMRCDVENISSLRNLENL
ncbi:RNA recognition motif domain - like 10, partial [Theobroma cacao]